MLPWGLLAFFGLNWVMQEYSGIGMAEATYMLP